MSSKNRLRVVVVALAAGVAGVCEPAAAQAQTPAQPVSPREMEAIYAARADSALSRFSAADVAFVSSMIHHHAQAITMSEMAPTHGASQTVRTLAARIINGQVDEIVTMQEWLAERGQTVPEVPELEGHVQHGGASGPATPGPAAAAGMDHAAHMEAGHTPADHAAHMEAAQGTGDHAAHAAGSSTTGAHDHADMPGMLTPAQLARLDAARGEEFDRLYLAMMILHHEGAVTMVEELVATDGALQDIPLFRLASDIQAEQRSEIDRMTLMLREMTGSPLGPVLLEVR